jgi:hypothetical protein
VDKNGSLWVIEAQDFPRRIVQYKTDGTFVKEILGNTNYGGAGTLNRYDKSRAYFGPMEFELDWTKHTSRLRGLMALRLETSDLVAVRAKERTYLVSTPLSMHDTQGRGIVYLYDDATGTVRLVAAFGDANGFGPLRASAIVDLLKGDVPRDYKFVWSDRNGNGALDADEVQFEKKGDSGRHGGVGRFDAELGCPGFGAYYFVKEFLANGAPVYDKRALKQPANVRLASGNFLALHRSVTEGARSENVVTDAEGRKLWGYPAHGGVSGLSVPGWTPGHVGTQFAIVGHETAGAGDLGECFVTHANTGQWFLWTADGLLAGQILRHKADPRARLFGPAEAAPGTRLDPLSASQEHFHGFFTRSEADGKHYLIAGFTHMSVIEVSGIEKFRRVSTEVKVTDDDLRRAREWEARRLQRRIEGRALLVKATRMDHAPDINGRQTPGEWGEGAKLSGGGKASFHIGYDDTNLYLCWNVEGQGPLKNAGGDFHRFYKTGACVDLMLSTDSQASPARTKAAAGDLRLLFTVVQGQPKAVLYQPVYKGAKPDEAWKTFTQAGGETAFDRVALLSDAKVVVSGTDSYVLEAAVPLATLGLKPKPGLRLKLDWGVQTTTDGNQVKARAYWANSLATGTADEAVEARLEPGLWGHVGFQ